jgi:hypothetical protein
VFQAATPARLGGGSRFRTWVGPAGPANPRRDTRWPQRNEPIDPLKPTRRSPRRNEPIAELVISSSFVKGHHVGEVAKHGSRGTTSRSFQFLQFIYSSKSVGSGLRRLGRRNEANLMRFLNGMSRIDGRTARGPVVRHHRRTGCLCPADRTPRGRSVRRSKAGARLDPEAIRPPGGSRARGSRYMS